MNSALIVRMRELWGMLAARERRLVALGAVLLSLIVLYLLLWLPLQQELYRLRAGVPEGQAQLARMRQQAAAIQPFRGRAASVPAPGTLVSVVDQSATGRGLRKQITKLEADGSNGVQLTAEAISFNSLIAWLADLRETYSLITDNLSVDAHTTPGTVNARLRMRINNP
jgi:general secretion pathway protein M